MNRREFLNATAAIGGLPLVLGRLTCDTTEGRNPGVWRDRRFHTMPRRPWRKIHLDFHNSHHVPRIGVEFDADEWGDTLASAHVDGIVVVAKDMHGFCYYPSETGPVHPGLSFDLLGAQVRACRQRNIKVYAYYCVTWDHYLAAAHPDWRMRRKDGSDYMPKPGQTPGWTALCLANPEFRAWMDRHIREFMGRYELDGAWFDMAEPIAPECHCAVCRRRIVEEGGIPDDPETQRAFQHRIFLDWHRHARELVRTIRPDAQVDFNDIGLSRVSDRAALLDNIDIEALPTGHWGYYYAPLQIRYQRNFGIPVYGMTGRFLLAWGDFGGLKTAAQLKVELASIVANGARCDVGDQMPPNGKLDPAIYRVIGQVFEDIRAIEPWLAGAAPVTEAAMLIPDQPLDRLQDPYLYGMCRLLLESHLQFDAVEPSAEWERYRLVIWPDAVHPRPDEIERLHRYIERGGAVLAIGRSALGSDGESSWMSLYGFRWAGSSPYRPAYMVPQEDFTGLPCYEYALYEGGDRWVIQPPAVSVARLGEPLFQRSAEQYTSHRQTPIDRVTEFVVAAYSGRVGLIGFPLGLSYHQTGYWAYRALFEHILRRILPDRMVETNAPPNTEITVTCQIADANSANAQACRWIVHMVHWSPSRGSPAHPVYHDHVVPLHEVRLSVSLPLRRPAARTLRSNRPLAVQNRSGRWEFIVPKVEIHEAVVLEELT